MQETRPQTRRIDLQSNPAGSTTRTAKLASGSVFFIGNATALIRFAGFTILTDPTFIHMHEEVSIGYGMHSRRLTNPAMEIGDLPPLDFVLLSHFHGDHFDQEAEAKLDKGLPIITTAEAAGELGKRGFHNSHALETWEAISVVKGDAQLRITALPARHGPPIVDLLLPEVMGSLLEWELPGGDIAYRMYITGDTLMIDELHEIRRRYPEIDLALLHLGGTMVLGILVTMDAAQGVEALQVVQPQMAIPIHYNDYDVFKSSLEEFQLAVAEAGLGGKVRYLSHGDTYTIP